MHFNHFVTFFKKKKHYKLVAFKMKSLLMDLGPKHKVIIVFITKHRPVIDPLQVSPNVTQWKICLPLCKLFSEQRNSEKVT